MDQGFYPSRLTSGPKRWFSQNILVRARCQFCDDIVVKYWRHSYFMWRLQTLSHRGLPSPVERRSKHVGDVECSFEQVVNTFTNGQFDSKDPLNCPHQLSCLWWHCPNFMWRVLYQCIMYLLSIPNIVKHGWHVWRGGARCCSSL